METGILTRLTIHKILIIIKTRSYTFDNAFIQFTKNQAFTDLDKKFIHNVVLNSMRYNICFKPIIYGFAKNNKL